MTPQGLNAMTRQLLSSFCRSRRANVALISAILAAPVAVGGGAMFDLMRANDLKSKAQDIADGAALAGAHQLADSGSVQAAQSQAVGYVRSNAGTTPMQADAKANLAAQLATVEVSSQSPTFVLGLLGAPSLTVKATAQARVQNQPGVCVLALNGSAAPGLQAVGAASIQASACQVWVNSAAPNALQLVGAASLKADKLCVHGGVSAGKPGALSPAAQDCGVRPDPFAGLEVPTASVCDFNNLSVKGSATLNPGIYCGGLSVGGKASLQPGIYVIRNGALSLKGQGSLTGRGVTFVLEGASSVDLGGGGDINLTAPNIGPLAGIVFFQKPDANPGGTATFRGGSDAVFQGVLYFPTQTIDLAGNAGAAGTGPCSPIIADRIRLHGASSIKLACDNPDFPIPPVLQGPPEVVLIG
jgi:Flp pilus assembly protein TadG